MFIERNIKMVGVLSLCSIISFLAVAVLNIICIITQFTKETKCDLGLQR